MIDTATYQNEKIIDVAIDENSFEEKYIRLRKKEKRIYSDEEVALLPYIHPSHIHYKEWMIRKLSSERLINYLHNKNRSLRILEIGCGNGWLSSKLAGINNSFVTAQDINLTELKQAFKIFGHQTNLSFVYGEIHDKIIPASFDIIVFAASIQYFPSLKQIIGTALSFLNTGGEIHILDTHFYKDDEVENAIERSKNYYSALGHPEMCDHYFHHTIDELKTFDHTIVYNQNSFTGKWFAKLKPFPWIQITKNK